MQDQPARKPASGKCSHYWTYEHTIYQGRSDEEVAVVRWCALCGLKQMALTDAWRSPLKMYDLSDIDEKIAAEMPTIAETH